MSLDNAYIFKPKKGNRSSRDKENSICFSITKTKRDYVSIKFYLGSNIARKTKINEQSRLQFGCDKDDPTIWYIIANDKEGYAVRKDKYGEYSSIMNFPFEYLDAKMECITNNNIEINSDKRIITMFVFGIFTKESLKLK